MIVLHFLALIILFITLNELAKPFRTYKYNDEPAKPLVTKPRNKLKDDKHR